MTWPVAEPGVEIELTVADVPYDGVAFGHAPSMSRSEDVAFGAYRLAHYGLARLEPFPERPAVSRLVAGTASAATELVLFVTVTTWLHEEWHRAVLARRDITSRDGVWDPRNLASGLIPVDRVADDDLARLKADHPAEFVRMSSAGLEAQQALNRAFADHAFFRGGDDGDRLGPLWTAGTGDAVTMWLNVANSWGYLLTCADPDAEARLAADLHEPDPDDRDFTGLDCTAWVYDLFRPDEPYEDRGVHPSGVGVDRYRWWSDLTDAERRFLRAQARLWLINAADPALYGIQGVVLPGGEATLGVGVAHQLLAFGWSVDPRVRFRRGGLNVAVTGHVNVARDVVGPGLDVEIVDVPLRLGAATFELQPRLSGWMQPEGLRWDAARLRPGGLAGVRLGWRLGDVTPWVEVEAKTEGHVIGVVWLEPAVSGRVGVRGALFGP